MRPDASANAVNAANAATTALSATNDAPANERQGEIEILALDDARFDVAAVPEVKFDVAVVPAPGSAAALRLGKTAKQGKTARQEDAANIEPGTIGGGDDRLRYLAMVAATSVPPLRQLQAPREPAVTAPAPRTRAECERRCGSDGFCDPSSASGCGGEYCLPGRDLV
jgi:hypothetical protein